MAVLSVVLSGLALSSSALALPQLSFGNAAGVVAGKCAGQSCQIASLAGVTGEKPTIIPEGGSASGWTCVAKYNPEGKAAIDTMKGSKGKGLGGLFGLGRRTSAIEVTPTPTEVIGTSMARNNDKRQLFGGGNTYTGSCKANIVIFAKGTTEVGALGITVGPALQTALRSAGGSAWEVFGVNYSADMAGNNCVGLIGGHQAKAILESAAQKCPQANLYTSGYSQGAMVARIAVAYAEESVKARVKGIVVYGDPFNGAKIKGYNGPIKTFCRSTDAVCTGAFKIGAAHMAYAASTDVSAGAKFLVSVSKGNGA